MWKIFLTLFAATVLVGCTVCYTCMGGLGFPVPTDAEIQQAAQPPSASAAAVANEPGVNGEEAARFVLPESIYFDYDSAIVRRDQFDKLTAIAGALSSNNAVVRVHGYCDERGNDDYNIALGEARARAVCEYLQDLGIERRRLDAVTHGEDGALCNQHEESCWSQNRRVEFEAR